MHDTRHPVASKLRRAKTIPGNPHPASAHLKRAGTFGADPKDGSSTYLQAASHDLDFKGYVSDALLVCAVAGRDGLDPYLVGARLQALLDGNLTGLRNNEVLLEALRAFLD